MNMIKNYNLKDYRRNDNKKGMRVIILLLALITILILNTGTALAAVDGITKDNYMDYVKPVADVYGYNIGECDRPYLNGEEYFYNEYYDHWNVDRVYSADLVPADWNEATEATTTTTKKVMAKKSKKSKKAKAKKKNKKKSKKSKKSK